MRFAPQPHAFFDLSSDQSSAPAALVSLLFDPPQPQNMRKKQYKTVFRDFFTFSHADLLSPDSLLWFFLL